MKKTTVITGCNGYIGVEVCKLLANNKDYRIIGIDNRFIVDRVKWLIEHNIEFYERDIFNCRDLLNQADVCIHLAGITDVAFVNTESNPIQDALIRKVGIEGTLEVINHTPPLCKIIFPSSHVLFEGLRDETLNIKEYFEPCPILAYSTTKRQNEIDLLNSGKNVTILRLASVYGYSENMRVKIVGNLFAKMASQKQKIRLFAGGINYKPCVGVKDVARFFEYLIDCDNFHNGEIFHLINENYSVKQIAEICKEFVPELEIISTNDEIPNKGYTLSNEKILETGFKFSQDLRTEIANMIKLWKNKTLNLECN